SNHLNATNYPHFDEALRGFAPDVLLAYPSSLELLTHLAEEHKSKVRLKLVITSSETLRPGIRRRVRDGFDAALLDYYGMAERVCAAYSLEDGVYRFVFPYGYAELVPGSNGRYRIVGTGLWNRLQPLRRYDTEDVALLPEGISQPDFEGVTLGLREFAGIQGR